MKLVSELDRERWSDFVSKHPYGNIFQTPEMYEVYRRTRNYEPYFLAVINDNADVPSTVILLVI